MIDCMIAMPGQLFYSTQISVCIWFLARDKSNGVGKAKKLCDRRGEILFIDARKLGHMVDRTRCEFGDADIAKIAVTYHAWREGGGYADVPGFACGASHDVIAGHGLSSRPAATSAPRTWRRPRCRSPSGSLRSRRRWRSSSRKARG